MKSSGVDKSSKDDDSKQGEDPALMGDLTDLPIRKPDTERHIGTDIVASRGDPAE